MIRALRGRTVLGSAALVALLSVGLTACGDDDGEAAAPSTAEFCLEMQQLDQGDDDAGPYTAFYEKHPDPTAADWGADGYFVTESIQAGIDEIRAAHPSQEAEPLVADVLSSMKVIKQNSIDISEAGKNDDQAAIDDLEQVNQDTNVPGLMAAIQAVGDLCEASAGS